MTRRLSESFQFQVKSALSPSSTIKRLQKSKEGERERSNQLPSQNIKEERKNFVESRTSVHLTVKLSLELIDRKSSHVEHARNGQKSLVTASLLEGLGLGALTEAVLSTSPNLSQMAQSAGSLSASTSGLLCPVV